MMKKCGIVLLTLWMMLMMALPCFAAADSFTPSVTRKGAPELVVREYTDSHGITERYIAEVIFRKTGNDLIRVPVPDARIIPYAERESAGKTIRIELERAYEEVIGAESFRKLNRNIARIVRRIDPRADSDRLVAYELFDLTLSDEYRDLLSDENVFVRFTLDAGLRPDETPPIVMHRSGTSGKWLVVDPEDVTNNGDGTMTVDFPELCPILFLRIAEGTAKPSVCPLLMILLLIFLIVLCIVVLRTAFRKKKSRSGESRR